MRKLWKKPTSLILVLVMLLSIAPIGMAYDFDKSQSEWAETELGEAFDFGLTYPDITNNFTRPITREEFCTIVVKFYEKLSEKTAEVGEDPFTDTDNPEILKAYKLKIVNGISADKFAPSTNITRQEICVMIYRALVAAIEGLVASEPETFNFTDAGSIADWAIDAVKYCNGIGVMKGTTETTISPLDNTTREQGIILLKRAYETGGIVVSEPNPDSDKIRFEDWGLAESIIGIGKIDLVRLPITFLPTPSPMPGGGAVIGALTAPVKGIEFLGRGYDVIAGGYADEASFSERWMLDYEKLLADGQIFRTNISQSESSIVSGTSIEKYSQSRATSVGVSGNYLTFKASVNTNFASSSASETNRSFATLMYKSPQYRLYINPDVDYSKYLTQGYKKDVEDAQNNANGMTYDKLIQRYGTHVVRSIDMGGRIEHNVTTSSKYSASSSSYKVQVSASFNIALAGGNVSVEDSGAEDMENFRKDSRVTTYAHPSYGYPTMNGAHFDNWYSSMLNSPGICDFGPDGLVQTATFARSAGLFRVTSGNGMPIPISVNPYYIAYQNYAESHNYLDPAVVYAITGLSIYETTRKDAGMLPAERRDNDGTIWHKIGVVGVQFQVDNFPTRVLYVKYGYSDAQDPVVGVFMVNWSQGENAEAIFKERFQNKDPSAKLHGLPNMNVGIVEAN